jgi:hypothetical protein
MLWRVTVTQLGTNFLLLWNAEVYYRVHKSTSLLSILCHINPALILITYFNILSNFTLTSETRCPKCCHECYMLMNVSAKKTRNLVSTEVFTTAVLCKILWLGYAISWGGKFRVLLYRSFRFSSSICYFICSFKIFCILEIWTVVTDTLFLRCTGMKELTIPSPIICVVTIPCHCGETVYKRLGRLKRLGGRSHR